MKTPENKQERPASNKKDKPADHEPGAVRPGIADADKLARTGTVHEPVRDTPPAGDWNDVA